MIFPELILVDNGRLFIDQVPCSGLRERRMSFHKAHIAQGVDKPEVDAPSERSIPCSPNTWPATSRDAVRRGANPSAAYTSPSSISDLFEEFLGLDLPTPHPRGTDPARPPESRSLAEQIHAFQWPTAVSFSCPKDPNRLPRVPPHNDHRVINHGRVSTRTWSTQERSAASSNGRETARTSDGRSRTLQFGPREPASDLHQDPRPTRAPGARCGSATV